MNRRGNTSGKVSQAVKAVRKVRIVKMVQDHFGEVSNIALAIFTAESGLRADAKGWNCHYGNESRACRAEDRHRAWSVDCGIAQLNFRGTECPKESFEPNWNIQKAYEWKFKRSGFSPWVVYKTGAYLKYL